MFNVSRIGRLSALKRTSRFSKRFQSTQALQEYFVVVWDRPGADRSQALKCDLSPPLYTYAGECLSEAASGKPSAVIGNGFACLSSSVQEVKAMMESSVYAKQGIWDTSSAEISPLLTVHSTYDNNTTKE
ncbi:hypothetical protein BKA59DRAFT_511502 [Fusarium tricinctum]|uniref:Uncharacterized protein n=1 Tax=Fusarium tricinctum TaxID=61284 RepID=A0A8K0WBN2_9HYPO|nr:hypothetical protein BKA59DRAFT_511502 [Fusarium tricinctum]